MINKISKFLLGVLILFGYYFLSLLIIKTFKIHIPPTILGLILFTLSLLLDIIKEEWIKTTVEFFLRNMAILFVPFIGGLIVYEKILLQNCFSIILVVLLATTLTIVLTGLFVEYGIKYLRFIRTRRKND